MFRIILFREVHEGITRYTFFSGLVLLTILVLLSAYTQTRYYQQVTADYADRQTIHQAENNSSLIVVTRPVPPMLPFYNGVYDSLPDEIVLRSESGLSNPSSEDLKPLDWLFPKTDLGLIIGVLMTLIALLIGHDAIAREREQGTLKLLLSNPISRRVVLLAKMTAVILLTTLNLIYALLLYLLVIIITGGGRFDLSLPRVLDIAVLTVVALLTLVVFSVLGVTISAIVKYPSTSLALGVGVWVISVLLWPSLGIYVASYWQPVSPKQAALRQMLAKEAEMIQGELSDHSKAAAELASQNTDVETAWQKYLEVRRSWIERNRDGIKQLAEDRDKQLRQQQSIARNILSVSPYGAFKQSLGVLCGTGVESYHTFLSTAELYDRDVFIPASFEALAQDKPWTSNKVSAGQFKLPPFEVPTLSSTKRLEAAVVPVCIIISQILLLAMIGLFSFERYDVR